MSSPAIDIDDAINAAGFGKFHILVIILIGGMFMTEIMIVQMLSVIGPELQCEWRLSPGASASLISALFIGMLAGDLLLSPLADKFGRRDLIGWIGFMMFVYSLLAAAAPTLPWLLCLILCIGFWLGGLMPIVVTFLIELVPTRWRGTTWFVVLSMAGLGSCVELLLAWPIMYKLDSDWRWLLGLTPILSLLVVIICHFWLPQSPRYSLLIGKSQEATDIINRIARFNGNEMPQKLQLQQPAATARTGQDDTEIGNMLLLFHPRYLLKQTVLLTLQMLFSGFGYFSMMQLQLQIPLQQMHSCKYAIATNVSHNGCNSCNQITFALLIPPSLADPISCLVMALIVEQIAPSRRLVLICLFLLAAAVVPLLSLCVPAAAQMCLFLTARGLTAAQYSCSQLFTIEFLPTSLRASGSAVAYGTVRAGIIFSPYLAQVFVVQVSALAACCILSGMYLIAAICTFLLKRDTKDEPVAQTVAQSMGEFTKPMLNREADSSYGSLTTSH